MQGTVKEPAQTVTTVITCLRAPDRESDASGDMGPRIPSVSHNEAESGRVRFSETSGSWFMCSNEMLERSF